MSIPKQCSMPDLNSLDHPIMGKYVLNVFPGNARITDLLAKNHVVIFIRLTDKALCEYKAAHACLKRAVQRDGLPLVMVKMVDHLETCINALARAFKHLDCIRQRKEAPEVPREFWRSLRSQEVKIRNIRGCVEHMYENLDKDKVAEGQPIALTVTPQGDAAKAGNLAPLPFSSLARTIEQLNAWASTLAQYSEGATEASKKS